MFVVLALALLAVGLPAVIARSRVRAVPAASGRVVGQISDTERAATFAFAPAVAPYDREVIVAAVARARPEAQRLVAAVDGLVDLEVAPAQDGAVGTTQQVGTRFEVVLNLGAAARAAGQRGIDRLVLHELGHVVDGALVPDTLRDQLVAQVPRGFGCRDAVTGACAAPVEIFAESFAKWATGDIGVNLNLGYAVPPPDDLQRWGAPLARLAG
ncbi:MAG: hypothetical protein QOG42_2419 [Solirubrobacteraceae bacterium]|jgi:hypothetical protein|nr:hypothetical protein [Solirubrobacteraceae bacterium]